MPGNVIGQGENGSMDLPVMPPVSPMLSKPVAAIPPAGHALHRAISTP
jgi:hypothetical protein